MTACWRSCRQFRMLQLVLRWRPGSLTISRRSCMNFTGCLSVSASSTNWQWWFSSACIDWHLHTSLTTVCLSPLLRVGDISGLLSPAASLSLELTPQLAQEALQLPVPKYGTVFRPTYDFTRSYCRHLDRGWSITRPWAMAHPRTS